MTPQRMTPYQYFNWRRRVWHDPARTAYILTVQRFSLDDDARRRLARMVGRVKRWSTLCPREVTTP